MANSVAPDQMHASDCSTLFAQAWILSNRVNTNEQAVATNAKVRQCILAFLYDLAGSPTSWFNIFVAASTYVNQINCTFVGKSTFWHVHTAIPQIGLRSKQSDQSITGRLKELWILGYPECVERRLSRLSGYAGCTVPLLGANVCSKVKVILLRFKAWLYDIGTEQKHNYLTVNI